MESVHECLCHSYQRGWGLNDNTLVWQLCCVHLCKYSYMESIQECLWHSTEVRHFWLLSHIVEMLLLYSMKKESFLFKSAVLAAVLGSKIYVLPTFLHHIFSHFVFIVWILFDFGQISRSLSWLYGDKLLWAFPCNNWVSLKQKWKWKITQPIKWLSRQLLCAWQ